MVGDMFYLYTVLSLHIQRGKAGLGMVGYIFYLYTELSLHIQRGQAGLEMVGVMFYLYTVLSLLLYYDNKLECRRLMMIC